MGGAVLPPSLRNEQNANSYKEENDFVIWLLLLYFFSLEKLFEKRSLS
jgi:hypothetical protein